MVLMAFRQSSVELLRFAIEIGVPLATDYVRHDTVRAILCCRSQHAKLKMLEYLFDFDEALLVNVFHSNSYLLRFFLSIDCWRLLCRHGIHPNRRSLVAALRSDSFFTIETIDYLMEDLSIRPSNKDRRRVQKKRSYIRQDVQK